MCSIHLYTAVSLDGYIADSDGCVAWLDNFQTDYGFSEFLEQVQTIIIGRTTYEQVLGFGGWPYADKRVIVLSRNESGLLDKAPANVEFYCGDVRSLADKLGLDATEVVWLVGGARTNAQFLQHKLIDCLHLAIMPLTLGRGLPLFTPINGTSDFYLVHSKQYVNGVVMMQYRLQGPRQNSLASSTVVTSSV